MALPGSPHDGTIGSAQLPGNNEAVAPDRAAGVREDAQPAAVHRNIRKELFMRSKNMNIKIWPRKKNDKGGYACMPLKKNVPEGHDGWRLTTCPECGTECWESPLLKSIAKSE